MTHQNEILEDPNYIAVLDHGFVGLVDHMGDDTSIVQAARVSYGSGTKTVREDRGLIRYLFRHRHTSPTEMCDIKYHIRCPIIVMRQLVRHRTASLNEYSGRYSVMTDEFYLPEMQFIQPQSTDNKQGRAGDMSDMNKGRVRRMMSRIYETAYNAYKTLLAESTPQGVETYDDPQFDQEFPGIARELARSVLPVGNYTELYWKQNLHNLFHLLKLRLDPHAQYEIRVFADAMYKLIQPIYPLACEAFEDYLLDAMTLSRMETNLVSDALKNEQGFTGVFAFFNNDVTALANHYGLTKREAIEFMERFEVGILIDE